MCQQLKVSILTSSIAILLLRLRHHLSRRRLIEFWLLICLMLISAVAEVVSLSSVLPFLGMLVAPEQLFSHPKVIDKVQAWGITSADQLVLPITIAFTAVALMAGAIRILLLWANTRFAVAIGTDLSIEVYRRTLYQPYQVHAARNSSEVISGITNKVNGVVFGVFLPLLTLVSSVVLLVAITLVLIAIDPMVASMTALGFGATYVLISRMTSRRLHRNSQRIAFEQTQVVKALQEGLGGIREVLLDGAQQVYCDTYRQADYPLRRAQGDNSFISGSPRYVMEAIGIALIATLAYFLSRQVGGIATALPVLGALALGSQRLLPAFQQCFSSWANISGHQSILANVIALLDHHLPSELMEPAPEPLIFQNAVCFDSIKFRYECDGPWVLDGLNLNIPKGARVGFVGNTGSGKSTTLDILMGLLTPTEGELKVDGKTISGKRVRAWQQIIAHVPQSIFLTDATLAENIAFGVPPHAIDLERVKYAAEQAQIANFIESRPKGYQAFVGERGIRLSGGQRQRIGIARALYRRASLLVFDEATSALDNETEQSVMDAIKVLSSELTILIVAHRLTTLKQCDFIVELKHGKVVTKGNYEQLLNRSSDFHRMAAIT